MSFPNYEAFQGQQGPEQNMRQDMDTTGGGAGASQQQQTPIGQQGAESSSVFQGGNSGEPGSTGDPQQGGDAKTTLWYVRMCHKTLMVKG